DLCTLVDVTAATGAPPTAQGRHVLALVLSSPSQTAVDKPAILVVAAHHARELVTPVIALDLLDRLLQGHGRDPELTALLDTHEVWIAPVWNPDGYAWVFDGDHLWRKNR